MEDYIITDEYSKTLKPKYLELYQSGKFKSPGMLDLATEMQLDAIGDFVPLKIKINLDRFRKEISAYKDKWVPYLHREGVMNDREGLNIHLRSSHT